MPYVIVNATDPRTVGGMVQSVVNTNPLVAILVTPENDNVFAQSRQSSSQSSSVAREATSNPEENRPPDETTVDTLIQEQVQEPVIQPTLSDIIIQANNQEENNNEDHNSVPSAVPSTSSFVPPSNQNQQLVSEIHIDQRTPASYVAAIALTAPPLSDQINVRVEALERTIYPLYQAVTHTMENLAFLAHYVWPEDTRVPLFLQNQRNRQALPQSFMPIAIPNGFQEIDEPGTSSRNNSLMETALNLPSSSTENQENGFQQNVENPVHSPEPRLSSIAPPIGSLNHIDEPSTESSTGDDASTSQQATTVNSSSHLIEDQETTGSELTAAAPISSPEPLVLPTADSINENLVREESDGIPPSTNDVASISLSMIPEPESDQERNHQSAPTCSSEPSTSQSAPSTTQIDNHHQEQEHEEDDQQIERLEKKLLRLKEQRAMKKRMNARSQSDSTPSASSIIPDASQGSQDVGEVHDVHSNADTVDSNSEFARPLIADPMPTVSNVINNGQEPEDDEEFEDASWRPESPYHRHEMAHQSEDSGLEAYVRISRQSSIAHIDIDGSTPSTSSDPAFPMRQTYSVSPDRNQELQRPEDRQENHQNLINESSLYLPGSAFQRYDTRSATSSKPAVEQSTSKKLQEFINERQEQRKQAEVNGANNCETVASEPSTSHSTVEVHETESDERRNIQERIKENGQNKERQHPEKVRRVRNYAAIPSEPSTSSSLEMNNDMPVLEQEQGPSTRRTRNHDDSSTQSTQSVHPSDSSNKNYSVQVHPLSLSSQNLPGTQQQNQIVSPQNKSSSSKPYDSSHHIQISNCSRMENRSQIYQAGERTNRKRPVEENGQHSVNEPPLKLAGPSVHQSPIQRGAPNGHNMIARNHPVTSVPYSSSYRSFPPQRQTVATSSNSDALKTHHQNNGESSSAGQNGTKQNPTDRNGKKTATAELRPSITSSEPNVFMQRDAHGKEIPLITIDDDDTNVPESQSDAPVEQTNGRSEETRTNSRIQTEEERKPETISAALARTASTTSEMNVPNAVTLQQMYDQQVVPAVKNIQSNPPIYFEHAAQPLQSLQSVNQFHSIDHINGNPIANDSEYPVRQHVDQQDLARTYYRPRRDSGERKRSRTSFKSDQRMKLEAFFNLYNGESITQQMREALARDLHVPEKKVKTWLKNRRQKKRNQEGVARHRASPDY